MVLTHGIAQRINTLAAIAILIINVSPASKASDQTGDKSLIEWQPWSQAVFDQAQQQQKFVLLDLEAVWCHWCHVMDQKTYSSVDVAAVIKKHFIAVKVDHDARPDLAQRYRQYGWPATIVFASNGTEIVKRAGYISPENFVRLLLAIVDDPTPESKTKNNRPQRYATSSVLPPSLAEELNRRRVNAHDKKLGGYNNGLKFLDEAYLEYAIARAADGNAFEQSITTTTLDSALALIDPAWGGAYQYSTYNDWQHPHYEKIMTTQARYIKLYASAYAHWKTPRYLQAAKDVARYLEEFLMSEDGAFYTSQDADVVQGIKGHAFFKLGRQARKEKGMPRIDTNQYSQENGWAIEALAALYEATGQYEYLNQAQTAALWVIKHRSIVVDGITTGGFLHDYNKGTNQRHYFLGDNLAMANAFLQLHRADASRQWLSLASDAAEFIDKHLRHPKAGFQSATSTLSPVPATISIDENITLTRLCNLLYHYTGKQTFKQMAEHSMRWLLTPKIALERIEESGILLAAHELANAPIHLIVIGRKDNKTAQMLYATALQNADRYKRIEWWDTREGKLPNPDILYPLLEQPAAFVCTNGRCSTPSFDAEHYQLSIEQLTQ